MRAEELISLAAAHGVDLLEAARTGNTARPKRDTIKKKGAVIYLEDKSISRVNGRETFQTKRPHWTVAEIGQAACGVPDVCFRAACYAFAGERAQFWPLHAALHGRAQDLARRRDWPLDVTDHHGLPRPYLAHLAKLVLDEDLTPHPFRVDVAGHLPLYAIYMGVTQRTWEKTLQERYAELVQVWRGWLGTALSIIQPRLAVEEASA